MEKPLRLVLIDDDDGVLRALSMVLRAMKFEVETFNSPQSAIEYATTTAAVDLVVSDLRMPGLTGEDVVRRLKSRRSSLPVVIMSGHATSNDVARLRAIGMSAFISKPFTPDQLLTTIRELFGATACKVDVA
jgi:DNA-binding NtrC family response regulator